MMMMMVGWKKHHLLSLLTTGADQLDHGISTFVTTLVALPAEEAMLLEKIDFFWVTLLLVAGLMSPIEAILLALLEAMLIAMLLAML